jgi:hypothetical protein
MIETNRVPFDVKYRKEIESREYKIETYEGKSARIICWDAKDSKPIVALINYEDREALVKYYENGKISKDFHYLDLFIVNNMNEQKFTIEDLKPFDKVLVRNFNEWKIDFFSHYKTIIDINNKEIGIYVCMTGDKEKCVPYNQETEYLLGTSKEYQGKYKTW